MTRYRTIVADPPWEHNDEARPGWSWRGGRPSGETRPLDYSTLTVAEIAALPVKRMADYGGHLYLWTTTAFLRDAYDVVDAWGFHSPIVLVWHKPSRGFAPGGTFQNNVEFVLYARRRSPPAERKMDADTLKVTTYLADWATRHGIHPRTIDRAMGMTAMARVFWFSRDAHRCACPTVEQWAELKNLLGLGDEMDGLVQEISARKRQSRTPSRVSNPNTQKVTTRVFTWPRGEHSAKPDAFLDMVEQVSPGPYLELFARRARFGWDYWGDQSLGTAELSA